MIRSLVAVSVGWLGISMVADGVPALLVPHQVASSGGDATTLGILTLGAIGLAALVQPAAGAWSDRIGRRRVIGAGTALAMAGLALLAVPALVPATLLAMVGVSLVQAGYQPLVADRVAAPLRGRAAGLKGLFDTGGAFVAFALLAAVLSDGRVALAAAILALGLVASVAGGLALLRDAEQLSVPGVRRRPADDERDAATGLVRLILARFLFLLGIYAVGRFLLLFVVDRLGMDADVAAGEVGAALAVLTLATAVAAVPAGWLADRVGRRPLMLSGGILAAIGIAALAISDSMVQIVLFGTLMAIGSAAFASANWAALADVTAGRESGRLLGVANFGTAGAAAAAGLFGPFIDSVDSMAPGSGYSAALLAAAAIALCGGLVAWRGDSVPTAHAMRPVQVGD